MTKYYPATIDKKKTFQSVILSLMQYRISKQPLLLSFSSLGDNNPDK
jgi:hypothetical protein